MLSNILCKKRFYFKNFMQQMKILYNSSPLFVHFVQLNLPMFYNHQNHDGDVTIISFAMGTHEGDPLKRPIFALIHFKALCFTTNHLSFCLLPYIINVATLALGLQPRQRGYKVAGQEEARESRQRGRKGAGQEKARESHHILPGV